MINFSGKLEIKTGFGFVLFCRNRPNFIRYVKSCGHPVFCCELCPSILVFLFSKGYFLLVLDSPLLAKKLS